MIALRDQIVDDLDLQNQARIIGILLKRVEQRLSPGFQFKLSFLYFLDGYHVVCPFRMLAFPLAVKPGQE